jgi:apolipoprotein N-acyltransferase
MSDELLRTGRVDLLIWPETVYPTTFGAPKSEEGAEFDREITAVPRRTGVPLVFGAFENGGMSGEHNAAFFLDGHGDVQIYRKSLLFPLTEYVPAWLDAGTFRAALPWTGRWSPGSGPSTVVERIAGVPVRFEPLICYEAIHLQYVARAARAGPDVLLTLSNDAWFDADAGPRLHLAAAALASVETRLPQIRATNSGISTLILPTGEIVSPTPFGDRASLRISVPLVARQWTPAVAWGDWLGPAACLACVACVLVLVAMRSSARPVRSMT